MSSLITKPNRIVGLSWKKLKTALEYEEMDDNIDETCSEPDTPVTRSQTRRRIENAQSPCSDDDSFQKVDCDTKSHRLRKRARSFRMAVNSFRQVEFFVIFKSKDRFIKFRNVRNRVG